MKVAPDNLDVFFLPGSPPISNDEICRKVCDETKRIGPIGLLIVDTSAAYFKGDDENSNAQLGDHARMMRKFTNLPGGPTVIVTCHPVKNADRSNLLPRGGGAFLNEMDGNLVGIREPGRASVEVHWHGKFRSPDFAPLPFKLVTGTTDKLKDSKGRKLWTVTAHPITAAEREAMTHAGQSREDQLLLLAIGRGRRSRPWPRPWGGRTRPGNPTGPWSSEPCRA